MPGHERRSEAPSDIRDGAGALERLLETERELAGRLADAERESAQVVREAEREAAEREAAFDRELARELEALRARDCDACDAAAAEAGERARREAARFDSLPDETIDALADEVLASMLGLAPEAAREVPVP